MNDYAVFEGYFGDRITLEECVECDKTNCIMCRTGLDMRPHCITDDYDCRMKLDTDEYYGDDGEDY